MGESGRWRRGLVTTMLERVSAVAWRAIDVMVGGIHDPEERRKRSFLIAVLLILIPALLAYGASDLVQGRRLDGFCALGLAALFGGAIPWCRSLPSTIPVLRVIFACVGLLLLWEIGARGGEGFAFLWAYLLPVSIFVVFGVVEGRRWVLTFIVAAAVVILAMPVPYERPLVTRFLVTLVIVALFAHAIESSRSVAARELGREKSALVEALAQIRTLSGLLPICAECKKIRDDQGYWRQVEYYIAERTDAHFTHGICPGCMDKLYPEVAEKVKAAAAARKP